MANDDQGNCISDDPTDEIVYPVALPIVCVDTGGGPALSNYLREDGSFLLREDNSNLQREA